MDRVKVEAKSEGRLKVRINIRIDADLVEHFKREAEQTLKSEHPVGYQTLINQALHEFLDTREYLDRILREKSYTVIS